MERHILLVLLGFGENIKNWGVRVGEDALTFHHFGEKDKRYEDLIKNITGDIKKKFANSDAMICDHTDTEIRARLSVEARGKNLDIVVPNKNGILIPLVSGRGSS